MKKSLLLLTIFPFLALTSCALVNDPSNSIDPSYSSGNSTDPSYSSGNNEKTSNYSNTFKPGKNVVLLKAVPEAQRVSNEEISNTNYTVFQAKYNEFASMVSDDYFKYYKNENAGKNTTISPLSLYFATAQAASCAAGDTERELFNFINVNRSEAEQYSPTLFKSCNEVYEYEGNVVGRQELNNSLWFEKTLKLNDEGLNTLVNSYYCEPYGADFINESKDISKKFNSFLKDKTRGLIDPKFEFSELTRLVIANTLYMKDNWKEFGELDKTAVKEFINSDNSVTEKQFLSGNYSAGLAYEDENVRSFTSTTFDGFSLRFIVPKGNKTIDEVFTKENLSKIRNAKVVTRSDDDKVLYQTRCIFPEFTAESNEELTKFYQSRGVNTLFDSRCDMSNILAKDEDTKVACSSITHIAKLKVEPKGIEGAAVTVMIFDKSSYEPRETKYFDFVVDRSFGFEITNRYGVSLFTGIVNKI